MSENAIESLLTFGILSVFAIGITAAFFAGRDYERTKHDREDLAAAHRLRATIRALPDDADTQFVPQPVGSAESIRARRCVRGPECCLCEGCRIDGIPPSP